MIKPIVNIELKRVTVHFKPWKGRISNVAIMIEGNIEEEVNSLIDFWKEQGMHKQRTITDISYSLYKSL